MTATAQQVPFGANFPSLGISNAGTAINQHSPASFTFSPTTTPIQWNLAGPIFPLSSAAGVTCSPATPCQTGAFDPNFKQPRSIQWNLDIQRAVTNNFTLDIAYVGNHGYNENHSVDLNSPALGAGWDAKAVNACLASAGANFNNCKPDTAAEVGPYSAVFPYLSNIVRSTSGFNSNYNGLQVTADQRVSRGLSFIAAYTYAHALDQWSKNSQGTQMMADPSNPRLQYGNGDQDIRHRFILSPTYKLPGIKTPGEMLEGWSVSGIVTLQSGLPWGAIDPTTDDFTGTGENRNTYVANPNSGVVEPWNFAGPKSAFNATQNPIPCYGVLGGCTPFSAAPASIQADCRNAATGPYAGNTQLQQLALASLANSACYTQNGGFLTPPAYGTVGDAGRNSFRSQPYRNVDFSVQKIWNWKERYSAQFRMEFFNLFNRVNFASPSAQVFDPTKGVSGGFGYATATPDFSNAVLGSGGPRHIQFGLKLLF